MNHIKKLLSLCAVTLLLAACGGGGGGTTPPVVQNPATITGQVQQGNIVGAQVFLDLNGNGVQDAGEPGSSSATGADGKFTLSLTGEQVAALSPASATAKIACVGGTDTTTGLDAGLLVADPPAVTGASATGNVTPMSTLLAMAPAAQKDQLKTVLKSLGLKDDALIEGSSSAVVALCKSVETVLITLQKSVTTKVNADVAREVARKAAMEMGKALSGKSKADLINTETLANTLSFAAGEAVGQMPGSQLSAHTTQLTTAMFTACKAAADAVMTKNGNRLATDDSVSEVELMDDTVKGKINDAVGNCITSIENEVTPGTGVTPITKTATVAFSATNTAALPVPVQGLSLTTTLPVGATVDTVVGSNAITSTALTAAGPNMQVTGTFTADTRKVQIIVVMTTDTFTGGKLADLTVDFPSASTPAASAFAVQLLQAGGFDATTHSNIDLTGKMQAALGVTFN